MRPGPTEAVGARPGRAAFMPIGPGLSGPGRAGFQADPSHILTQAMQHNTTQPTFLVINDAPVSKRHNMTRGKPYYIANVIIIFRYGDANISNSGPGKLPADTCNQNTIPDICSLHQSYRVGPICPETDMSEGKCVTLRADAIVSVLFHCALSDAIPQVQRWTVIREMFNRTIENMLFGIRGPNSLNTQKSGPAYVCVRQYCWLCFRCNKQQANRRLHFTLACTPVTPFPLIGDAAQHQHAGGGQSHGRGQHAQRIGKDRECGPEISSRTDRQTDRETDILITILRNRSRGRSNKLSLSNKPKSKKATLRLFRIDKVLPPSCDVCAYV